MTELGLALIVNYGVLVLFIVTFLSCLALPVPSSLMMLASGSFAASGDLNLPVTLIAAYFGAIAGDNFGYYISMRGGSQITGWLQGNSKRSKLLHRAEAFMNNWGGTSLFLSRWLVSPLGPYVNFVSGISGYTWLRFFIWGALGEIVWVGVYVGLGYEFADQINMVGNLLGSASGFMAALTVAIGLGWWLLATSRPIKKPA